MLQQPATVIEAITAVHGILMVVVLGSALLAIAVNCAAAAGAVRRHLDRR